MRRYESPQAEDVTKYDAVLGHGYWLSQRGAKGSVCLSRRSRLTAFALAKLYYGGRVKNIVLATGPAWGEEYPSFGSKIAEFLTERYNVPVILRDTAMSTQEEIDRFDEEARKNDWRNLVDLAFAKHHWTIPGLYPRDHEYQVTYKNVEDIIKESGVGKARLRLLDKMKLSREEISFAVYEGLQWLIMKFDPELKTLNKTAHKSRVQKKDTLIPVPFISKLFGPIDWYDL